MRSRPRPCVLSGPACQGSLPLQPGLHVEVRPVRLNAHGAHVPSVVSNHTGSLASSELPGLGLPSEPIPLSLQQGLGSCGSALIPPDIGIDNLPLQLPGTRSVHPFLLCPAESTQHTLPPPPPFHLPNLSALLQARPSPLFSSSWTLQTFIGRFTATPWSPVTSSTSRPPQRLCMAHDTCPLVGITLLSSPNAHSHAS